jgi:hypothetical protein
MGKYKIDLEGAAAADALTRLSYRTRNNLGRQAHAGRPVADGNVLPRIPVRPARMERGGCGLHVGRCRYFFFFHSQRSFLVHFHRSN